MVSKEKVHPHVRLLARSLSPRGFQVEDVAAVTRPNICDEIRFCDEKYNYVREGKVTVAEMHSIY